VSYDSEEFANGLGRTRNGNPNFYKLLERLAELHDRKSHDYASNDNPSGNYHFAGQVAAMFSHSPKDAGFAGRIAEKVYRLANLESGGKIPKNESVEDTERDICVITLLWMSDREERRKADTHKPWERSASIYNQAAEGLGPYPAAPLDETPDVEVYQLLGNIAHMINQFLNRKR
jgi:hypothetical protein